jgi:hypothetical protein
VRRLPHLLNWGSYQVYTNLNLNLCTLRYYNTLHCGHPPYSLNPVGGIPDEPVCPGLTQVGTDGCEVTGLFWPFEDLYGPWPVGSTPPGLTEPIGATSLSTTEVPATTGSVESGSGSGESIAGDSGGDEETDGSTTTPVRLPFVCLFVALVCYISRFLYSWCRLSHLGCHII